jgi:nucleoside-triphosphatase
VVTNLLITGLPRSGKTTLIKKILELDSIGKNAFGFFTEEFRKEGRRAGFHIVTIPEGRKALLSQAGLPSQYLVGRYGVDLEVLDELGCQTIQKGLNTKNIIIVDEIGKMELYSKKFRNVMIDALNSRQKVLAIIMERPHAFADGVKIRPDVKLLSLTRENFGEVFLKVVNWLDK